MLEGPLQFREECLGPVLPPVFEDILQVPIEPVYFLLDPVLRLYLVDPLLATGLP